MCDALAVAHPRDSQKERKKTDNPREGTGMGGRHAATFWDFKERKREGAEEKKGKENRRAERKKERKQTRQTRDGTRTGSPPARAGFWKDDQGDRWGSPAPDKGHDRLAARCAVDSHIHWRSHLSLATCLQLVAGSLSHMHTDTGVAGAAARVSHILCGPH